MGLFANLLEKLGLKKPDEKPSDATASLGKSSGGAQNVRPAPANIHEVRPPHGILPHDAKPGVMPPGMPPFARPQGMAVVDVVGKLDKMAATSKEKLDWKVSIVDMLKLVGMDSSLAARKEMAQELGCPANLIGGDYADMNVWLHKEVLKKFAEHGGNIPPELLNK